METTTDVKAVEKASKTKAPNFSKMSTRAIEKAIADGKYEGDTLDEANAALLQREAAADAEKEKVPAKKKAAKKEKKKSTAKSGQNSGVSEYLRKIMTPKEGSEEAKTKTCAVTYSEANKKVVEKFPTRKKLYPSEFDRNFEALKKEGVLKQKQQRTFKTSKTEKKADKPAKKSAPKKAAKKEEVAE